jgi:hypothetical protein
VRQRSSPVGFSADTNDWVYGIPISPCHGPLINTPLQRGQGLAKEASNRFSGFWRRQRGEPRQTAKAVAVPLRPGVTPLKRGVNQQRRCWRRIVSPTRPWLSLNFFEYGHPLQRLSNRSPRVALPCAAEAAALIRSCRQQPPSVQAAGNPTITVLGTPSPDRPGLNPPTGTNNQKPDRHEHSSHHRSGY